MSPRQPLTPFTTHTDASPVLGYLPPSPGPNSNPYRPAPSSSPAATPSLSHNPNDHLFPPPPSPLTHKESDHSLAASSGAGVARRRALAWPRPSWEGAWKYGWMVGPLVGYALSIALMAVAIWQEDLGYGSAVEVNGTGRLDLMILNSCSTMSNSTVRICTPRSAHANFIPSLVHISPAVPGFAILQLPFRSSQTPVIFLSAFALLFASLLVFLPVWTVFHFPRAPLPRWLLRIVRFYPSYFYQLAALLSGAAFTITITIGIGYELYMLTFGGDFIVYVQVGIYEGLGDSSWTFVIGNAFNYVYTAVAFQALLTISTVCALHNGFDETIEYQDLKGTDPYRV